MADGWEANPFDARCAKCGQGYYKTAIPNFCPSCGERIGAPLPSVVVKPPIDDSDSGEESEKSSSRSRPSSVTSTSSSSSDYAWLKTLFKILFWLVVIAIICFVGFYVLAWLWAILCFIFRHWFISLIVAGIVIYGASKS
jgi:hypothetical protein